MFTYFIVWLTITILICFSVKNDRDALKHTVNLDRRMVCIAGMIFVIFASFRKIYPHTDIYAYNVYFNNAEGIPLSTYLDISIFEPIYTIIIWLFRQVTSDFRIVLIFVYSSIFLLHIYLLKYISWNKYKFGCIAIIFISMFSSLYLMRNYISVSICYVSVIMCYKKKYTKACIFASLAITFHNAALILFPMIVFNYLFDKKDKIRKTSLLFFITLCIIGTVALSTVFENFMAHSDKYFVYSQRDSHIAWGVYTCLAIVLIFSFIDLSKLTEISDFNKTLIISTCANTIVIPLQAQFSIMYRMNLYFIPFHFILLMELSGIYNKKSLKYFIIRTFTIMYSLYKIYIFFSDEIQYITEIEI